MSAPKVLVETHAAAEGQILEIVINRPEVHNAIDGETARALLAAWRRFRDDPQLFVAILRGAGTQAFSSGADLAALEELAAVNAAPEDPDLGPLGGTRIVPTKPVITVSQGHTYAGGLELYCLGHIRLAEPQAVFSVACRRWGVPLVDGGTVRLPRLLGLGNALPLIITGVRVDAPRARELGLVWEIVEPGRGVDRAFEMAQQICRLPQEAMRGDLKSAVEGWDQSWSDALTSEAANLAPVMQSSGTVRGIERFLSGERWWFA